MANARSVNVKRVDLLEKLKINRDKHATDYVLAYEGYKIEVEKLLEAEIAKVVNGTFDYSKGLELNEDPPTNYTSEYDNVIAMMEMSVDETINLDSSSFQQYVLDNWSWKQTFSGTVAKYASNVGSK